MREGEWERKEREQERCEVFKCLKIFPHIGIKRDKMFWRRK